MERNRPPKNDADYYDIERIASTTDCTGMIPAAVTDEDVAEIYAKMFAVHPVKPEDLTHTSKASKHKGNA